MGAGAATIAVALTVGLSSSASAGQCSLPANWSHIGTILLHGPTKWAYPSQRLDLQGSGPYTIDYGPVPASFSWGTTVHALSVETPPGWNVNQGRLPADSPRMVTIDGMRFLRITSTIVPLEGQAGTCSNFRVWIYA
jgi:hypothetical protein